jgi:hypothetical protein
MGYQDITDSEFMEIDSVVTVALRKNDEGYAALRERKKELETRFPFIEPLLEGTAASGLSKDELTGLAEHAAVSFEMERRERLSLYLAGHRDCLAYLKRIGAL